MSLFNYIYTEVVY